MMVSSALMTCIEAAHGEDVGACIGPQTRAVEPQVVGAISWAGEKDHLPLNAPDSAIEHLNVQIAEAHRKVDIFETQHTEQNEKDETPKLQDTCQLGTRHHHIPVGPRVGSAWLWRTKCGWPFGRTGACNAQVTAVESDAWQGRGYSGHGHSLLPGGAIGPQEGARGQPGRGALGRICERPGHCRPAISQHNAHCRVHGPDQCSSEVVEENS